MENQDKDFLEVRLDHTGAAYLKKLSVTTRWIFILGMLMTLLLIVYSIFRNDYVRPERFSGNWPLYLEMKVYNWYVFFYCLFFSWQVWCYLQFARQASKGADLLDTTQFNHSFRSLYRSSILVLVHLPLSICMWVLEVLSAYYLSQVEKLMHK